MGHAPHVDRSAGPGGPPAPAAVLHGALGASPTATPLVGADAARLAIVEDGLRHDLGEDFEALTTQGAGLGDVGAVSYAVETLRGLASRPTIRT